MGDQQYQSWAPITVDELKAFFDLPILMSVNHLPSLDDYWSRDQRLQYAPIADRIPRWRFREISRYLHFVDNDHFAPCGDAAHDWLGKVWPLITHLSNKFATLDEPSKEVAVDKFQGRSSLKQYMPKKLTKHGMVLGDSTNGYFSEFDVHTGGRIEGLGAHVVKKLTDTWSRRITTCSSITTSPATSSWQILKRMVYMDVGQPGRSSQQHSRTLDWKKGRCVIYWGKKGGLMGISCT